MTTVLERLSAALADRYAIQEEQPAAVVDVVSGFGSGGTCGG